MTYETCSATIDTPELRTLLLVGWEPYGVTHWPAEGTRQYSEPERDVVHLRRVWTEPADTKVRDLLNGILGGDT